MSPWGQHPRAGSEPFAVPRLVVDNDTAGAPPGQTSAASTLSSARSRPPVPWPTSTRPRAAPAASTWRSCSGVGPIPSEIQNYTVYAGGLGSGGRDKVAAGPCWPCCRARSRVRRSRKWGWKHLDDGGAEASSIRVNPPVPKFVSPVDGAGGDPWGAGSWPCRQARRPGLPAGPARTGRVTLEDQSEPGRATAPASHKSRRRHSEDLSRAQPCRCRHRRVHPGLDFGRAGPVEAHQADQHHRAVGGRRLHRPGDPRHRRRTEKRTGPEDRRRSTSPAPRARSAPRTPSKRPRTATPGPRARAKDLGTYKVLGMLDTTVQDWNLYLTVAHVAWSASRPTRPTRHDRPARRR